MPRKTEPKPRPVGRPPVIPGIVPPGARWHSIKMTDVERLAVNAFLAKLRRK